MKPFLSTCPVRGTTTDIMSEGYAITISIHVPREGHDRRMLRLQKDDTVKFLSTCPVRGTTGFPCQPHSVIGISIHVPREGHDTEMEELGTQVSDFYPRAP